MSAFSSQKHTGKTKASCIANEKKKKMEGKMEGKKEEEGGGERKKEEGEMRRNNKFGAHGNPIEGS